MFFHCLQASIISLEKFVFILIAISFICDVSIFPGCFQNFGFIFGFHQFDYYLGSLNLFC